MRFFSTKEHYRVRKDPRNYQETFRRFERNFFEREKRARKAPRNVYGPEKFSGLLRNASQFSD